MPTVLYLQDDELVLIEREGRSRVAVVQRRTSEFRALSHVIQSRGRVKDCGILPMRLVEQ